MDNRDFGHIKALVCDDSYNIRALVRSFLTGYGVPEVFEAPDAQVGFMEFIEEDPDLVITAWNMGDTSGLDLINLIRWSDKSPNKFVPIIMLTGYTERERVIQARNAGITGYLAKPFTAASLYKQLCSVSDDRRPFIRELDFFGPDRRTRMIPNFEGSERRQIA